MSPPLDPMAALRATLAWVRERSPFYRHHLAGVAPDVPRTPQDLVRLPTTSPDQLRAAPGDFLCLSQSQVARALTVHSSGTSGPAKRVFFSREELEATAVFFRNGMDHLLEPRDTVLALLPHLTPDGAGDLLGRALDRGSHQCRLVWPPGDPVALARSARRWRPGCLVGLPVHLLALAEALGPGVARAALCCSEYAPPALVNRLEAALEAPVYIHYGSSESGLGGAVECRQRAGCHGRLDIWWEVLRIGGEEPVEPGQVGELVLTTLFRRAMPLIRYRTGDRARLDRQPCACGHPGPRIHPLGRLAGAALPGGATLAMPDLDQALFALPNLHDFRVWLEGGGKSILWVEYTADRDLDAAVSETLTGLAPLAPELAAGRLALAPPRRVPELPASHTIKRAIQDLRTQETPS